MFNRHIHFFFLLFVFLLGSPCATMAMESYASSEESSGPPKITAEDQEAFDIIQSTTNPLLGIYEEYDAVDLTVSMTAEIPFRKYLYLKNPDDMDLWDGANSTIFIGILENKTKVFIKRSGGHYDMREAMAEFVMPKIARIFFDIPTLLPTQFIGNNDHFEVRQYFIDGALPENMDSKTEKMLNSKLKKSPEAFNRSPKFLDELKAFDAFVAADDRNETNYLWVPYTDGTTTAQNWFFYAIDYAEMNYDNFEGLIDRKLKRSRLKFDVDNSVYNKLCDIQEIFTNFFQEAEDSVPGVGFFEPDENPASDNSRYFSAMKKWQDAFLMNQEKEIKIDKSRKSQRFFSFKKQ